MTLTPNAPASVEVEGVSWPVQGAQVAMIEDGKIVLQLRPWPPGWELPGGHCDAGEDPAVTAAREVEEETGYRIRIDRVVGVYTWGGLRNAGDVLYLAAIVGGRPRRSLEAWALHHVAPDEIPRTLFPWMRQRVLDAFACAADSSPVHRVQPVTLYHVASFATAWMQAPLDRLRRRRSRRSSRRDT
jgi:8-oxo-dGTP pyrophosphatase MutT (NUDIX family)